MTSTDSRPDLDRELRRALEPGAATVERIVRNALAPPPPRRRWPVWVLATAAVLALAVLIPAIRRTPPPEHGPEPPSKSATLSITNDDGFLTITSPDGTTTIMLGN